MILGAEEKIRRVFQSAYRGRPTDYINVILFAQAINVDPKKFATGDPLKNGGGTRSAVIGGGRGLRALSAAKGFLPLLDQITPLLTFADQPQPPFKSPTVRPGKSWRATAICPPGRYGALPSPPRSRNKYPGPFT